MELKMPDGSVRKESLVLGDIKRIPVPVGEFVDVKIKPHGQCDVGAGDGKELTTKIEGGVAGVILDARGRPLVLPKDGKTMKRTLIKWLTSLEAYPEEALKKYTEMSG